MRAELDRMDGEVKPRLASDLTDADLARLVRLIRVFCADPDYAIRADHVRDQWAELAAQDEGTGYVRFDDRERTE